VLVLNSNGCWSPVALYAFLEGSLLEEFSLTTPKAADRADQRLTRAPFNLSKPLY
jgi:hypothetical protein